MHGRHDGLTDLGGRGAQPLAVALDDGWPAGGGGGSGPAPARWVAGTQFSRYEIESLLAAGGMAEVWRAKIKGAEGFEKRVVIKTMLTQYSHRTDLVEMFVREATLAAQLSHPNIVDVFDFGQLEGRYFIAMEYVPGVTLRFAHRRMLARGSRLPVPMILHVMKDVCEALQHVHDLEDATGPMGVVHRDLSPDNIILSTSSTAKLIDFGAARATGRTPQTSLFVGKYRYAAPERIRMMGEDHRSDVYSAGVILHECLTGVRPFDGSDVEVIKAVTASRGCDPRRDVPELPDSVAQLVLKATAPRARDRFEDASDLGGALGRCLAELRALSKEREVTAALSVVLESAGESSRDEAGPSTEEGVPEVIGEASDRPSRRTAEHSNPSPDSEAAFHEMEIVEASGPIRRITGQAPMAGGTSPRISTASFQMPTLPTVTPPPPAPAPSAAAASPVSARTPSSPPGVAAQPGVVGPPAPGRLPSSPPGVAAVPLAPRVPSSPPPGASAPLAGATRDKRPDSTSSLQQAVELFDRGVALRTQHRFAEALAVWERALLLAPENRVYQSNVRRLRDELDEMDRTPPPVELGNEDTTAVRTTPGVRDDGHVRDDDADDDDEDTNGEDTAKVNVEDI